MYILYIRFFIAQISLSILNTSDSIHKYLVFVNCDFQKHLNSIICSTIQKGSLKPPQYLNHDEAGFFFTHTQKHAGFLWCEKVYTNKAVTNSVCQVLASITEGSTA